MDRFGEAGDFRGFLAASTMEAQMAERLGPPAVVLA
jgi:hypothetical protein